MRRMVLAAVLAVAMLAMLVPPALAQTPKVTITGLFDQVMSLGKNYSEVTSPETVTRSGTPEPGSARTSRSRSVG